MKKKLSGILLLAILIMSLLPVTASAGGYDAWDALQKVMAGDTTVECPAFEVSETTNAITITLKEDITGSAAAGPLRVPEGKNVILRLNGHKIDRNVSTAISNGEVILVQGSLSVIGNGTDNDLITGGNNSDGGGGVAVNGESANFSLNNAAISGNYASDNGGGIFVNWGKASISNSTIRDNHVSLSSGYGGGIFCSTYSEVSLTYTKIENNSALCGGGIYTSGFVGFTYSTISGCTAGSPDAPGHGGAVCVEAEDGTRFEASGGLIENCSASGSGGAVCVNRYFGLSEMYGTATFANGITIKDCTAGWYGGGIAADGVIGFETANVTGCTAKWDGNGIFISSKGRIFIGKAANVTGNTADGVEDNLYIADGGLLTVGSGPDVPKPVSGMNVGITMENPGVFSTNEGTGYLDYFHSDDTFYQISLTDDDNSQLMLSHSHHFTYTADRNKIIATCTEEGCEFNTEPLTLELMTSTMKYDGAPYDGASTNDAAIGFSKETGKTVEIEYTERGSLMKLSGAPTNAGSYSAVVTLTFPDAPEVTAKCNFLIQPANLTINTAEIKDKVCDGTTDAEVTEVTFNGLQGSDTLELGKDYIASGVYNSAEYAEADKVTVTVTLLRTQKAGNYTISSADSVKDFDKTLDPPAYQVIRGAEQIVDISQENAGFTSDAPFAKFVEVKLDGKLLDKKYYTVKAGSTVVTLNQEILSTLAPGTHTLKIVSSDGSAETTFTIVAKEVPPTGDTSHILLWIALSGLSLSGIWAVGKLRKFSE